MDLKTLRDKGAFVSPEPVRMSGEWTHWVNGDEVTEKFEYFVVKPGFGVFERFLSSGDAEDRAQTSQMIALCVRLGDDGAEEMTYEDAYSLDPSLASVFVEGIKKVNGLTGDPKA